MAGLEFIDHVAITVADVDRSTRFFDQLFGVEVLFDHASDGKMLVRAVRIGGGVHLNIHQLGNGMDLVAAKPTPGSADICFRFGGTIEEAEALLAQNDIAIIEGPSPRVNNEGNASQSVYFLDPDGNLLELMAND